LAVGRMICILKPNEAGMAGWGGLAASFAKDPRLGATAFGAGAVCGLIAREGLWTALGGLEPAFDDWKWAIQDFCQRTRSIGFLAPAGPPPREAASADASLFRHRAALAPDLSAVSRSGSAA